VARTASVAIATDFIQRIIFPSLAGLLPRHSVGSF
jgi:hypothetical protein